MRILSPGMISAMPVGTGSRSNDVLTLIGALPLAAWAKPRTNPNPYAIEKRIIRYE